MAKAKANTEEKAEKKPGVGDVAIAAIRDGKTNEEALAAVKEAHPDANTSIASINWYRGKLRADGVKLKGSSKPVPTSRELKAKAKAAPKKGAETEADDPLA